MTQVKLEVNDVVKRPALSEVLDIVRTNVARPAVARKSSKRDLGTAYIVQEQCQKLCLSLFYREHAPIKRLGLTSALAGEGKSFLSVVSAGMLAQNDTVPVTLIECNWEHPTLHEYFGIPGTPGVAEWLRGECTRADISHQVGPNLTVMVAGNGQRASVRLLRALREKWMPGSDDSPEGLMILELPPVVSSSYGATAASLAEAIVLVVRAGVTPEQYVSEACVQLADAPLAGVLLNQMDSKIPQWIRQLL